MKVAELAIAAPQVIAHRTARMLAAGADPDKAQRAELSRMCTEKVQAFWESLFAMSAQTIRTNQEYARRAALQWLRLASTPWWLAAMTPVTHAATALSQATAPLLPNAGRQKRATVKLVAAGLAPVHKRATANARRLARKRTKR